MALVTQIYDLQYVNGQMVLPATWPLEPAEGTETSLMQHVTELVCPTVLVRVRGTRASVDALRTWASDANNLANYWEELADVVPEAQGSSNA